MPRVLITDNLSKAGLKILEQTPGIEIVNKSVSSLEELRAELANADGIIVRSATKLTAAALEGQTRLKVIVRAGVGVDTIDLAAATRQGIIVMNTPAGNTTSTAELTVAMLMAMARHIGPASQSVREGKWDRKSYTGVQLAGKTLGVIGLGRIGQCVAKRAQGLEMKIVGIEPFMSDERAAELGIEIHRDIDQMLPKCDFLTVHTPATPETLGMINATRLASMKKGARIVNCARGGIVEENALADAIEAGHIAGAAIDVFVNEPLKPEDRLPKLKQVLCTPHLGASTDEAQENVAVEAAELITAFLVKNEISSAVNMTSISAAEMKSVKPYLDLSYRLGNLLAQLNQGKAIKGAKIQLRGEAASKPAKLLANAFTTGLMEAALDSGVNIVNAEVVAKDRGLSITTSTDAKAGAFSTLVSATIETDGGELTASGTMFGTEFLRLVKLDNYQMDAYLDGLMLVYRHRDVPGLIGAIGTTCGKHNVNISCMALGREQSTPGGKSIAILNLDSAPSTAALAEVAAHPDVTGVQLVQLPKAGAALPRLGI
ncbi:MAG: phosphoglycerate dehydrogenase [Planctomycetota bacterium]|nr:MAG: phosphoglycerate dehydrogenase [Planctomycetota bacterium]